MAVDKELKRKIVKEWQDAFPQLTLYSQDKLYKVVGCLVVGIELIKLPRTEEYRPHFVIYPLWRKNINECLESPILLKQFFNRKGLQFSIPYEKHSLYFEEALESVKKQVPVSFEGDISLNDILSTLDEYSKTPPLNASSTSFLQAKLKEAMLTLSLYKDTVGIKDLMVQIDKINWNTSNFEYFGISVDDWLQSLKESINNQDELLSQVEVNKRDKKLQYLESSELI